MSAKKTMACWLVGPLEDLFCGEFLRRRSLQLDHPNKLTPRPNICHCKLGKGKETRRRRPKNQGERRAARDTFSQTKNFTVSGKSVMTVFFCFPFWKKCAWRGLVVKSSRMPQKSPSKKPSFSIAHFPFWRTEPGLGHDEEERERKREGRQRVKRRSREEKRKR